MVGRVSKKIANDFELMWEANVYKAIPRGKIKLEDNIYVGDKVEFFLEDGLAIITKVLPRRNFLLRPSVANVDKAIIIISKKPEPDLFLVDKTIINSYANKIEPIICYNKSDLAKKGEVEELFLQYEKYLKCIKLSTYTGEGIDEIKKVLSHGVNSLVGQSAVGKTSIINMLLGMNLPVGTLSRKIARGRHVTRHIEIFKFVDGMIMDAAGFSVLSLIEDNPRFIKDYYPEFLSLQSKCQYASSCLHINEPGCAIIKGVEESQISKERYERYLHIYEQAKKEYDNIY